jgi:transcriptional regulator with XRE-family HTH domain
MADIVSRKRKESSKDLERGARFRSARLQARQPDGRNMTLSYVAERFDISVSTVVRWEQGGTPGDVNEKDIAELYGVRVAWLMQGDGEMLAPGSDTRRAPVPVVVPVEHRDDLQTLPSIVVQFLRSGRCAPIAEDEVEFLSSVSTTRAGADRMGPANLRGMSIERLERLLKAYRHKD